jgi:hypothetical protein
VRCDEDEDTDLFGRVTDTVDSLAIANGEIMATSHRTDGAETRCCSPAHQVRRREALDSENRRPASGGWSSQAQAPLRSDASEDSRSTQNILGESTCQDT